jgi:uncharacterized protein YndB with AHSA1/START domain
MMGPLDGEGAGAVTDSSIERVIEIDAPADVVWRTITQPDLIRLWLSDIAEVEPRPGAVGTLTFRAGSDDPLVVGVTVVEVEPLRRFSYRWVHPVGDEATEANSSLVTFTIEADGEARTRLRVVESGVDRMAMSEEERRSFVEEHRRGWQVQGERLRQLLDGG